MTERHGVGTNMISIIELQILINVLTTLWKVSLTLYIMQYTHEKYNTYNFKVFTRSESKRVTVS